MLGLNIHKHTDTTPPPYPSHFPYEGYEIYIKLKPFVNMSAEKLYIFKPFHSHTHIFQFI